MWDSADEHRLFQLLAPGLLSLSRGPALLQAAVVKGLITLPDQNAQFSGGGEPLALAGRKSCEFCRRSLMQQKRRGWRGPSLSRWG